MDIHEEDYKILNFILDDFTNKAEKGLNHFSCDLDDDYEDMYDDDDDEEKFPFKGRVKCWSIRYSDTKTKDISFKFTPVYGTVSISIGYTASREFDVGFGPKNKDIKIKIMKLYHKIAAWEKVEIPRRQREKFIDSIVKTFPDLFDHLILGDEDGKKEDN